MKTGIDKAEMMGIVAAYNNGNGNPSAIPTVEICEQVLAAFEDMKTGKKG